MKSFLLLLSATLFVGIAYGQPSTPTKQLSAFAKAYGYVKYFHPSDEAADLDWNAFAAYGAQQVAACKNDKDLVKTLNKLFHPIAPSVVFSTQQQAYSFKTVTPKSKVGYEQTYWQHQGVSKDMNYQNGVYQSVRVNRVSQVDKSASFGTLTLVLDAAPYLGKPIKYTGWVKLKKGAEKTGHMWLRVDRPNRKAGFFDNMDDRPITSTDWQQYEIIGEVAPDAMRIVLGAFIKGKGTMYWDDVHLYYKENDEWKEIPLKNSDFEADDIGRKNEDSDWMGSSQGYGYGLSTDQPKMGQQCARISYEGALETIDGLPVFRARPQAKELIEKELAEGIFCQIPLSLYVDDKGTYPKGKGTQALAQQLQKIDNSPTNVAVRWGNVINTYNVFQHFYPYFEEVDVDWEAAFVTALQRSASDQTGRDHLTTLQRFTAPLKDGHIHVSGAERHQHLPPIRWEWIEDQLVVTAVKDSELPFAVGDVVTHIDQQTAKAYFKDIEARISAGTQGWLRHRADLLSLLGPEGSELAVTIGDRTVSLPRNQTYDYNEVTIPIQANDYKLLDNNLVYLNLDKIEMDTLNKLMPLLEAAQGIICDLRGYPNGNHGLIEHLMHMDDTTTNWMRIPQIIYPDQENIVGYQNEGWAMKARKPYLGDKKVVFITDGSAISYAESYMGFIDGYQLATIVGQPTAGTNGNINPFNLLAGFSISWTGMKVFKHDGSQHHGLGVLPDVYVEKTIEGVKAGRDEFLEAAVQIASQP